MSLDKLNQLSKEFESVDNGEAGRQSFISKFPLNKLKNLSIDQYVQGTDENSFCYWLEFKKIRFGIGGGNASKYGIYKAKDGKYYASSGKNKEQLVGSELNQFFNNIKSGILLALQYTENNEIEKIKTIEIPLWNMVLQKILSLYFPDKFLIIGASDVLIECARDIKIKGIDLKPENSIQINYECKKALSSLPEYKNWSSEKLGTFIWEIYLNDSKRNYYIIGSKYGENNQENIFPKLFEKSVISVGFASHLDLSEYYLQKRSEITKFLKEQGQKSNAITALKNFLSLKVGDQVAIKASGSPKGKTGFLSIVGIAEVIDKNGEIYSYNPDDLGHSINVKFIHAPVYKEFAIGGYGSTIHKLSKPDQIELIFKSDYQKVSIESLLKDYRKEFIQWLSKKHKRNSGTINSYVKAIDILSKILEKDIFKNVDDKFLRELYKDLIEKQRDPNGLYFHQEAPSYGNKGFYSESIKTFREFLSKKQLSDNQNKQEMSKALNTILYGPPGTGKTYNSIIKAIKIVNQDFKIDQEWAIIKDEYDRLVKEKRIAFTTFHQSMTYEDFIEGIKPLEPENRNQPVQYSVLPGIFKKICSEAESTKIVKLDIEDIQTELTPELFGEYYASFADLLPSHLENHSNFKLNTSSGNNPFYLFQNSSKSVVVKAGKKQTTMSISLNELTKVLFEDKPPVYRSYEKLIIDEILTATNYKESRSDNSSKPYVLIIDEINRGNVSAIFGELITLIEDNKRLDNKEELRASLPYSKKPFGVPSNLHIIGTMNTADRSVEALDSALRRRFTFEEMPPRSSVIKNYGKARNGLFSEEKYSFDLIEILDTINKRIEVLLDKDHQIGHSYFLNVNSIDKLKDSFGKQIIPLLQEYFYGDYGKITLVLGEEFCKGTKVDNAENIFAKATDYDVDTYSERLVYNIASIEDDSFNMTNAIKTLLKK